MDNLFAEVLADSRGNMLVETSTELRRVIEAIQATGKKGSITVTIAIVPEDGDANAATMDISIKSVIPKPTKPKSVVFLTEDCGLSRQDPKQAEMFAERAARGVASIAGGERKLAGVSGDMIAAS